MEVSRYFITDRQRAGEAEGLLTQVARALSQRVEMIQVREKDLSTQELLTWAGRLRQLPNPGGTKLLLNSRLDVALAAGFDGVHLPSDALAPNSLRPICGPDFLFGVSCHTLADVERASREGANFAVFSPVFESPGKGAPVGLEGLRRAVAATSLPIFALGGVTWENAPLCTAAGAAGIAGIRLFLENQ